VVILKLPVRTGEAMETMTFTIDNVNNDAADVTLRREMTQMSFRVEAPALEQALANIDKAVAEKEVSAGTYGSAASFAVERKVRLKDALEWAKKSVELDPKFYPTVRSVSRAL